MGLIGRTRFEFTLHARSIRYSTLGSRAPLTAADGVNTRKAARITEPTSDPSTPGDLRTASNARRVSDSRKPNERSAANASV